MSRVFSSYSVGLKGQITVFNGFSQKKIILDSWRYGVADIIDTIDDLGDYVLRDMDSVISSMFTVKRRLSRLEDKLQTLMSQQDYITSLLAELNLTVGKRHSKSCLKKRH